MKYRYDPEEDTLRGYYQCGECREALISGQAQDHKDGCTVKNGEDMTFVFGQKLVQFARTRARSIGSDSAVIYGGLSIKLIKEHCPEALQ